MHNVSDNINLSNFSQSENSLFDYQTRNLIIKILNLISSSEKKIEIFRRVLTDSRDFDFNMIFKRFEMDSNIKDKITPELILQFLRKNSIFCDIEKIKMFISFYDRDNDGSLNFNEFKNFLISSQDKAMRASLTSTNLSTQQWHTLKNYNIPINISHTLIKLFIEEIQLANKILELQKNLCSSLTYNAWNLYSLIDRDNKDSIYLHNLEDFLNDFASGKFSRSNLEALFYRMDISKDDRISFNEFQVFFTYRNYSKITSLENEEYFGYNIEQKSIKAHSKKSSLVSDENQSQLSFSRSPLNQSMTKSMNVDEPLLIRSINYSNPKNQAADRNYPSQTSVLASPYYKRFNSLEEEMLINFFKTLVDYEREIEEIRIKLAKHVDFNLCELFQIFLTQDDDVSGEDSIIAEKEKFKYLKNYHMVELLSVEKFKNGINFFNAYPTEKEMRMIFNRHIQKKSKYIDFADFTKFFVPLDLVYKKIVRERFRQKQSDNIDVDSFTNRNLALPKQEIKNLLQELFNKMISIEAGIESWRIKLNKIRTFNIKSNYEKIIARPKESTMNMSHLEHYLANFDFSLEDVQVLYSRFDKEGRNAVTYLDFSFELYPQTV